MNFKEFVTLVEEGGKAVENALPILSEYQKPTFKSIEKDLLQGTLGLSKKDYKPLGSTFKKPAGVSSGDMDISVGEEAISKSLKCEPQNALNEMYAAILKDYPNYSTTLMSGFGIVSIAWPIQTGSKAPSPGAVQVDLMLSNDVDFTSFLFHSPDFTAKNPSQYKGLYRTEFLKSIFAALPIDKISKKFEDEFDGKYAGNYKELGRLMLGTKGLEYKIKSYVGKKGTPVKTGKVISNELLSKSPSKIIKVALGDKGKEKDVDSFENLWKAFNRSSFPYKSAKERRKIVEYFVNIINTKGLPIPEEILKSKFYKG